MKKIFYFLISCSLIIGISVASAHAEESPAIEWQTNAATLDQTGDISSSEEDIDLPAASTPDEEADEPNEGFQSLPLDDCVTIDINIFINNILATTDRINSEEWGEIEYGTIPLGYLYGDYYGELQSGEVYFNGVKGYCFTWDPKNISILTSTYGNPEVTDVIVLNLYYSKADVEEPPVELGNVQLDISDGTNPVADYGVAFIGKRAAETITQSAKSNQEGKLSIDLDKSYTWTFEFNGILYLIDKFDYYTQLSLSTNVHYNEPVIVEGNTYTITITHYFCDEPGGTLVDNIPDNYTTHDTDPEYTFNAGDVVDIFNYVREVEGYHLGATYVRGAGAYNSRELTIADDYIVSIIYVKDPDVEPDLTYYSVTYKDGEQILSYFPNCAEGSSTPVFNTDTLSKSGYSFTGWTPTVADFVTEDAVYEAVWMKNSRPHRPSTPDPVIEPETSEDPYVEPEPEVPTIIEDEDVPLIEIPVESPEVEEPAEVEVPSASEQDETPVTPAFPQDTTESSSLVVLPQTGDMTKPWVLVMLFSGLTLVAIGLYGRRKEN